MGDIARVQVVETIKDLVSQMGQLRASEATEIPLTLYGLLLCVSPWELLKSSGKIMS